MYVNNIKIEHCGDIRTIGSMKEELEAGRASYWHWHTLKIKFISLYRKIRENKEYGILLPVLPQIETVTTAEIEGKMCQGGYDKKILFKMVDMYSFLLAEEVE